MSASGTVLRVLEACREGCLRQPLLVGASFFLAGIVCGYRFGSWPVAVVCAVVAVVFFATRKAGVLAGAASVFLLGWCDAAWDSAGRNDESAQLEALPQRLTLVCRVGSEVAATPLKGEAAKFSFRTERLRLTDGACAIRHLPAEVNWFGARHAELTHAPRPGETWRLTGHARVKKGRDGLLALTVNTGEERSERLAKADPASWAARVSRTRQQAAQRVTIGIEDWGVVPALNQAMLLGSRHAMPPSMRRIFADSGTIHVFAISGLHIVLVASVLVLVVSTLGVSRPYWVVFVAPLLVFYTVTTGARPSAIRACLMTVLYFAAPLVGRKPSGLAALAGTALIVHMWQPWLIYDIGCVLSFAVMGGLVVFCRPFCAAGQRLCRVERLENYARLLDAAGEHPRASRIRWLKSGVKFMADSFAVSLAAWLASVPLTAYYFGRFTPGGLFANLVIGPCSFFIVVAGCLGMAASFASRWVAECFNHAAGFFTVVMVRTAEIMAACPGGNFRIAKWEPWMVWVWFFSLALFAAWLHTRRVDGLAWMGEDVGQKEDVR